MVAVRIKLDLLISVIPLSDRLGDEKKGESSSLQEEKKINPSEFQRKLYILISF